MKLNVLWKIRQWKNLNDNQKRKEVWKQKNQLQKEQKKEVIFFRLLFLFYYYYYFLKWIYDNIWLDLPADFFDPGIQPSPVIEPTKSESVSDGKAKSGVGDANHEVNMEKPSDFEKPVDFEWGWNRQFLWWLKRFFFVSAELEKFKEIVAPELEKIEKKEKEAEEQEFEKMDHILEEEGRLDLIANDRCILIFEFFFWKESEREDGRIEKEVTKIERTERESETESNKSKIRQQIRN